MFMKRKRFIVSLIVVLLFGGWLAWRVAYYNAGPEIRRTFPGARPYFDPVNSPDPTISASIRGVMPSYFGRDESLGFSLIDSSEPLDLQARFSRLSHLKLFSIHFTRCRITNLCPPASRGFPSFIVFEDCDFSDLPPGQRSLLRPYGDEPKKFCIGVV